MTASFNSNVPAQSASMSPKRRPAGDFFGPFFRVKFYVKKHQPIQSTGGVFGGVTAGIEQTLTVVDQQAQETLDSIGLQNYASNLQLQFHPGMAQMTLTLTPPYQDALNILDSKAIQFGNLVGVTWGYSPNLVTEERLFTICQPSVSYGKDITFTITGIDTFSFAMRQRTTNARFNRSIYRKDVDVLNSLASLCGFTLYEPTVKQYINAGHSINQVKTTPIEQASSDWELFKAVCQGNNLVYHIGPNNVIYLYDRKATADEPVAYNFLWYAQPESGQDIPMMSFVTNPMPIIFTASPTYVNTLIHHYDPDSGNIIFEVYDPSKDPKNPTQGDPTKPNTVTGSADKTGAAVQAGNLTPVKPKPDMSGTGNMGQAFGKFASVPHFGNNSVSKHEGDSKDAAFLANTTATIIAPGHPDVLPPMNVFVSGVGKLFEGAYYIISARHTLGQSGYDMTLELVRTTTDGGSNAQVNTTDVPDGSGSATTAAPAPKTEGK